MKHPSKTPAAKAAPAKKTNPAKKAANQRFHQVTENDDGWSNWIHPLMHGYKMKCCGCGLVHNLQFKVTKITKRKRGGWKEFKFVANPDYEVSFRASRQD